MSNDCKNQQVRLNQLLNYSGKSFDNVLLDLKSAYESDRKNFILENAVKPIAGDCLIGFSLPASPESLQDLIYSLYYLRIYLSRVFYKGGQEILLVHTCRNSINEKFLLDIKKIADYFHLDYFTDIEAGEVSFEKSELFLDSLFQCAPVSLNGMYAESIFSKVTKNSPAVELTAEDSSFIKNAKSSEIEPEKLSLVFDTEAFKRLLHHDNYQSFEAKLRDFLFINNRQKIILDNIIHPLGGYNYLGIECPDNDDVQQEIILRLLSYGLIVSKAPYGGKKISLLLLQPKKFRDIKSVISGSTLENIIKTAQEYNLGFYKEAKEKRIDFEHADIICRLK